MATTVIKDSNILVIDDTVEKLYFNASWCSMSFNDLGVIITDSGKSENGIWKSISYADFVGDAGALATEALIFGYLKDKIG